MACNEHIAEIQSEAELFLIKVQQSCHGSTTESTAHKIAQLAHTENAASALFRASNFGANRPVTLVTERPKTPRNGVSTGSGSDRPPTSSGSPTDTRHRSSNKLLNLFRSKEKLPPNDLATLGTQPEPGPSSRLPSRAKNIAEGQTCFALNPQPSKATSSSPEKYHCLFCRKDYDCKGARGVFKRHLKDHHVAPLNKGYECYCGALFRKENEANAHVCEWRVFDWNEARLVRRIYACDYTGTCFGSSINQYLEHLLQLGRLSRDERPVRSRHVKLRGILSHCVSPGLMEQLSVDHSGHSDSWRDLVWSNETLQKAIQDIEDGVVELAPKPGGENNEEATRTFLTTLLSEGTLPRLPTEQVHSSASGTQEQVLVNSNLETPNSTPDLKDMPPSILPPQVPNCLPLATFNNIISSPAQPTPDFKLDLGGADSNGKRPRSFQSASAVSNRRPAAPLASRDLSSNDHQLYVDLDGPADLDPAVMRDLPLRLSSELWQRNDATSFISQSSTLHAYGDYSTLDLSDAKLDFHEPFTFEIPQQHDLMANHGEVRSVVLHKDWSDVPFREPHAPSMTMYNTEGYNTSLHNVSTADSFPPADAFCSEAAYGAPTNQHTMLHGNFF